MTFTVILDTVLKEICPHSRQYLMAILGDKEILIPLSLMYEYSF